MGRSRLGRVLVWVVPEPTVVFRDDDLLVVDKPAGLPTTAPSKDDACLVRWVEERCSGVYAHPTSRLDSPVSGLVTFALSRAANQRLLRARRDGEYARVYLGITLHQLRVPSGSWQWPISLDPRNRKQRVAGPGTGQKEAVTHYDVAATSEHGALLRLMPKTGRTHQLRVHAAKARAPLFGDHAYGGERRLSLPDGSVVSARRVMLHCTRIEYPWQSETRRYISPPPAHFTRVWIALGGDEADYPIAH